METWLAGGVVLGFLAGLWGHIKTFAWRLISLLIVRVRVENELSTAVAYLCWSRFRRSPFGERRYSSLQDFVRPEGRWLVIGCELVGQDPLIFWNGFRPILLSYNAGFSSGGQQTGMGVACYLTFLRGMFNLDALLIEAIDMLNERKHRGDQNRRFKVMRRSGSGARKARGNWVSEGGMVKNSEPSDASKQDAASADLRVLKWKREELGADDGGRDPFGALAFPQSIQDLIEECRRWKASENWYKSKRIAWRWGVGLYGRPGTGKTSFARAMAQELDIPIIIFDLASFSNEEFVKHWRDLLNHVPCMALIEDVDAVFSGRENRLGEEGGGLTFDCLLNCLSGIEAADGVLTVVTTNRIEELDEALGRPNESGVSSRPGRIDRMLELGPLDEDCRYRLASRILSDCPGEIEGVVARTEGMTGAQVQDVCSQIALKHYWSHTNGEKNGQGTFCIGRHSS